MEIPASATSYSVLLLHEATRPGSRRPPELTPIVQKRQQNSHHRTKNQLPKSPMYWHGRPVGERFWF